MPKFCRNCGQEMTDTISFCPMCGTSNRDSGQETVATYYSVGPYVSSTGNSSPEINPYNVIPPPPPPPPSSLAPLHHSRKPGLMIGIVSSIVIVLLILGSVGAFLLFFQKGKNVSSGERPLTTATTPPTLTMVPTQVSSQGCGKAFSDTFHGSLHAGWVWTDPNNQASYRVSPQDVLTISTTGDNDLNTTTNENAPRLLQPVTGDFTVQTLVELPSAQASGFQAAGILIWQDANNFIRVERYLYSIDFEQEVDGVFTHNAPTSLASSTIQGTQFVLQVRRNGDAFTASWSEPGQGWQDIGSTTLHLQNLMVGLDLISQGAPKTTANYDYFKLSCP